MVAKLSSLGTAAEPARADSDIRARTTIMLLRVRPQAKCPCHHDGDKDNLVTDGLYFRVLQSSLKPLRCYFISHNFSTLSPLAQFVQKKKKAQRRATLF